MPALLKTIRLSIGWPPACATFRMTCQMMAICLPLLLLATTAQATLYQTGDVPLKRFGFATAQKLKSKTEFVQFYDITKQVLKSKAIVRTALGWDPTQQEVPGFNTWSFRVLEPALARNIVVLPGIKTLNLSDGRYRMPTDAQWTHGLREIVRMYGPGGVYAKGGTYVLSGGKTVNVDPHPGFAGLTDYELWNEPNTMGNLGGQMTPAKITHLLKIGAAAMRDQARKLGFKINIIGPAVGGIDLDYVKALWTADKDVFKSIDTLSIHAYTRFSPPMCDAVGSSKVRCVKSFVKIRRFMDSHGGAHVRLATTEGGVAGDRGNCTGPQVRSEEEQRDFSSRNLKWIRARPWLKFDFWISTNPIDGTEKYSHACGSGKYDVSYWESKLGIVRADLTLKPWGQRLRSMNSNWNSE